MVKEMEGEEARDGVEDAPAFGKVMKEHCKCNGTEGMK